MKEQIDEIFHQYVISLHVLANELKIPTEKFTMDKSLMRIIESISKVRFKKDKKKIDEYEAKARDRIKKISRWRRRDSRDSRHSCHGYGRRYQGRKSSHAEFSRTPENLLR